MNARLSNNGSDDHVWNTYYSPSALFNKGFDANPAQQDLSGYYSLYTMFLSELCMNRFEWKGLPETVNVRYLEQTLFRYGLSIFYQDAELGGKYLALKGLKVGSPNYEDEYPEFQVVGNGATFTRPPLSAFPRRVPIETPEGRAYKRIPEECVPIYANYLRQGELHIVSTFAKRLANIDLSLDINSMNLRQPKLIASDQDTKLTADNINRQHDLGAAWIHVRAESNGQLPGTLPGVLDVGGDPDSVDALINLRDRVYASCMMFLGINNGPAEKAERVQAAEVDANNEQVASGRHIALNARREAADRINARYGLAVSVDYRVRSEQKQDDAFDASLDNTEQQPTEVQ